MQHLQIHQIPGFFQGENVGIGDFVDNLLQGIGVLDVLLLGAPGLLPLGKLQRDGAAKFLIPGKAGVAAHPHNGRRGGEGFLCQFVNAEVNHHLWIR